MFEQGRYECTYLGGLKHNRVWLCLDTTYFAEN